MSRRHTHLVLLFGALAALLLPPASARADGLKITNVTVGIGGRYRPGGWVHASVTAVNAGGAVQGQVQLSGDAPGGAVFARPVSVTAGPAPQTFPLDVRGLDPGREDLVAQIVSGAARGDGAVAAEARSFSATGHSLFSGVPVTDRDLLLVGFSADPSAFTALNGQKWGLMHAAGGVTADTSLQATANQFPANGPFPGRFRPGGLVPASAQVAAAGPADLPDLPAAYAGVDAVLLRADAPLDALSETQADALRAWVAAGGRLVVCGGADPALLSDSFFNGLLPAAVSPGSGNALTLAPKPLPGVRVLVADAGRPVVVAGPYGAGQVTVLAFDPALPAARTQAGPALWRTVFAAGPSSLLPVVAAREQGAGGGYYPYGNGGVSQLAEAVMRAPALDVPGADVVGLFLFSYLLVLVPVNYLVLKRLDKKEWAWATIPALVAVFAAGTYAVGYAAKGDRVFVNRAAILEANAGQRRAGVYAAVGLFSPRRTTYDFAVADPNALLAVPAPPDERFNFRRRAQPAADGYGPARVVEGGAGAQVQDAAVNMWAMRAFDSQTTADLGGAVTATGAPAPGVVGLRTITVTNHTPHALHDCRMLVSGAWSGVGDLAPGGTRAVTVGTLPSTLRGGGWGSLTPPDTHGVAADDPNGDVRQRMRAALAGFVRGLGDQNGSQYQYYGGSLSPPAAFAPRPGEAVLVGWCDDPALAGPPTRVDGHPVTENVVTLVVVHVPLP